MTTATQQQKFQADMAKVGADSARLLQDFAARNGLFDMDRLTEGHEGLQTITKAFGQLTEKLMEDPQGLMEMQLKLYQQNLQLWQTMAEKMLGHDVSDVVEPAKGDRRFKDSDWSEMVVFDFLKQSYLLTSNWLLETVQSKKGELAPKDAEKVEFYTRQFIDALAPTNFPFSNPEVLRKTVETHGENLIKGLHNLLSDLEKGRITLTDESAFEVGRNLATTPGKVVFRNHLIELIQYEPQTEKVSERPLLISPPWINKFYILDMRPENSFVRYAVEDAGQTTFIISWKNPDASYRDVSFEDYMKDGILAAVDVVLKITGQKDMNIIGYCIGGTLLAATLAWMAKKKDTRIHSATFFTTLIDFSESGELNLFIDEEQVRDLEQKMAKRGYLDGKEMAATFSMLRANDLIWSFVINNYLLGQEPLAFDLLYWNGDSTRMPYAMHSYYLRNMYMENNLVKKDKLTLLGEKIDISQIPQPIYMMSAESDHITPWHGCFKPLHKFKGGVTYALSSSGHVAGVANPPSKGKGYYLKAPVNGETNAEKWQAGATRHEGSWWTDWNAWINTQGGKKVAARKPGSPAYKPLGDAPGSYVKEGS